MQILADLDEDVRGAVGVRGVIEMSVSAVWGYTRERQLCGVATTLLCVEGWLALKPESSSY